MIFLKFLLACVILYWLARLGGLITSLLFMAGVGLVGAVFALFRKGAR